jgi:hypothetical protein
MAQQRVIYDEKGGGPAWLMKGAAVGGLSWPQVDACLKDPSGVKAMQARITANNKAFNVEGTPTFIINGKLVGDGEMTLVELDKAIAKASAPAPALRGAQTTKTGAKPAAASQPKPKPKAD